MKILHTSDWHLGHILYNYDRGVEQFSMLNQMAQIVKSEQPDVFLLCGDVYHTAQPSATIQTMFTNALVNIHKACPTMTIIATAGNHDSGIKHDIFKTPWQALGVYTIGNLNRNDLSQHIIPIPDKGYVIALPYINERNIPEGLFQQLIDFTQEQNTLSLPVILMAHTTIKGCDYTGHDNTNDYSVGGIDYLDLSQLGIGYDYLALGHIHHQQFVHTGKHNVRYCGTPIPVSFDENYEHTVSIVEINQHGEQPQVRQIAINNPFPLVTLPTNGFTSWDNAKNLLADFPNDIPAYIRLNIEIVDFLPPNAKNEAEQLIAGKQCRLCLINSKRISHSASSASHHLTINEFQTRQPIDIARQYAADKGFVFNDDMQELFRQALDEINTQSDNI